MAATTLHQRLIVGLSSSEEEKYQLKLKSSQQRSYDLLWKEYFRDPSQWWDNRTSKVGTAYPDFKHKATKECLWVDGWYNPPWVLEELRRGELAMPIEAQDQELGDMNEREVFGNDESAAFVASLRACAKNKDLTRGTKLHDDISKRGLLEKCSDALVTMYAKCGALAKAKDLLDMHKSRDVFSWTALITGYTRRGQAREALNCFKQMQQQGLSPDAVTFASILKACAIIKAADEGMQIHDEIARQGLLRNDIVLGNVLVDMYAKCGDLTKAQQVFEELPFRNVISWNTLITGYVQQGQAKQALNCFEQMARECTSPNAVTFSCILKACGSIGAADKGEQIHDEISKQGLLRNNVVLGTALVDMYAKCGVLAKAHRVLEELPFRDVVAWNAIIAGYAQQGHGEQALSCFEQMQDEGLSPNAVTLTCILKACGSIGAIDKGEQLHDEIRKQGLLEHDFVLGNALVDMYAKCGALEKAQRVLEELPFKGVAPWNALIAGYTQQGQGQEALKHFQRMQQEGISPDAVTFASVLKACGTTGAIDKGGEIHDEIDRQGLLGNDIVLGNALVDMYVNCGALKEARLVLEGLPSRNANSWTPLITGYAQRGQGQDALNCFEQMQRDGLSPDAVTFSCLLNACSHLGLVEDGFMYFINMNTKYGVKPNLEHYTCMIDLFGRAGHLDKAVRVIQEMPSLDDFAVWSALLGACWKWKDVKVGKWAFDQAVRVDKCEAAAYVLMANIYAAAGMHEDAETVEAMRMKNKAWKKPEGNWCMNVRKDVHTVLGGIPSMKRDIYLCTSRRY